MSSLVVVTKQHRKHGSELDMKRIEDDRPSKRRRLNEQGSKPKKARDHHSHRDESESSSSNYRAVLTDYRERIRNLEKRAAVDAEELEENAKLMHEARESLLQERQLRIAAESTSNPTLLTKLHACEAELATYKRELGNLPQKILNIPSDSQQRFGDTSFSQDQVHDFKGQLAEVTVKADDCKQPIQGSSTTMRCELDGPIGEQKSDPALKKELEEAKRAIAFLKSQILRPGKENTSNDGSVLPLNSGISLNQPESAHESEPKRGVNVTSGRTTPKISRSFAIQTSDNLGCGTFAVGIGSIPEVHTEQNLLAIIHVKKMKIEELREREWLALEELEARDEGNGLSLSWMGKVHRGNSEIATLRETIRDLSAAEDRAIHERDAAYKELSNHAITSKPNGPYVFSHCHEVNPRIASARSKHEISLPHDSLRRLNLLLKSYSVPNGLTLENRRRALAAKSRNQMSNPSLIATPMTSDPKALLFVYGEPGAEVTDQDFNDWYDNEHAPARAQIPGFFSTQRYKSADGSKPTYLALYDISSPSTVTTPPYTDLFTQASDNEKSIIPRCESLQRRVYTQISSLGRVPSGGAAPSLLVVETAIKDSEEADAEFNKWYEEEHIPLLSKVPGVIRGRRYRLDSWGEIAKGDKETKPKSYLAVYELESLKARDEPSFKEATSTPWMKEVGSKYVLAKEIRVFNLWKNFMHTV